MEDDEKRAVSPQNIVRRLYRRVKRIEALYQEIDELYDLIPAPTPEEFDEMASGKQPLTLEVLLIGVLGRCLFHLSEANVVIDYYRPYTPRSLSKGRHKWRDFADQIRREVRWRAERLPAPPEGKEKPD